MKLVYSNIQNHGVNGDLKKMAANFAFQTGSKRRKLFAYRRNLLFPATVKYVILLCYVIICLD